MSIHYGRVSNGAVLTLCGLIGLVSSYPEEVSCPRCNDILEEAEDA